jgi:preprotein translocase subunit SecG
MIAFLTVLHVIVCFVLIVVILIQGGRGQGLTGPSFASGNVQSLFGTQAADFLTKATTVSAICFLLTCLSLNIIESRKGKSLMAGAQQTAPVDVEAVKKALEKVTAQQGANPASDAAAAAGPIEEAKESAAALSAELPQDTSTAKASAEKAAADAGLPKAS